MKFSAAYVKQAYASTKKSVFFHAMKYHTLEHKGIHPDPAKIDKVKCFPTPHNVSSLRKFVGLTLYNRHFVPSFDKIAAPLHALTKKDVLFSWTTKCEALS